MSPWGEACRHLGTQTRRTSPAHPFGGSSAHPAAAKPSVHSLESRPATRLVPSPLSAAQGWGESQAVKENASVFLGDPRTLDPRSNPGSFCLSLLASRWEGALLWSLRVRRKAIERKRNVLQGCVIVKGSASKLKPDCPQILANRNMVSPGDRDRCPGDWGWQATLGGPGSFWKKTQMN